MKQPGSISNRGAMGGGDYGDHLDIGSNFQQVRAPKIWYDKLKGGIEVRGFKYLNPEPRIFIYNKVIWISYVYNHLWFYNNTKGVDAVLKSFQEYGDK